LKSLSIHGADAGLSLISLYFLSDSLKSSIADLDIKVGAEHHEAVAAFYGASVGMMAGAVEMTGLGIKVPAKAMQAFIQRAGTEVTPSLEKAIGLGEGLVKAGGAIAAASGIADSAANFSAAARVFHIGDTGSAVVYTVAGALSIGGAYFGAWGALGTEALFGPLGIGIALGLLAFAATQVAKSLQSDALELWARNSCFSTDSKGQRWALPLDRTGREIDVDRIPSIMDDAVAALNAAVLGMDVALGFNRENRPMDSVSLELADVETIKNSGGMDSVPVLSYRIVLPGFDPLLSRYDFVLSVERFGLRKDGRREPATSQQTLASGQINEGGVLVTPMAMARPDYALREEQKPTATAPILSGSYWLEAMHGIKSATLAITYWPDKNDENGFASIKLTEMA
jgi:hypothetical protein